MKKHNTIKVVLITLLLFVLLTWILPAASFQSEFYDQGRIQMGLFDLFDYPTIALSYFGYISLYIVAVGGFYGILYKIPAYRNLLDRVSNVLKKRGMLSISLIMIILAILTSICGLQLGLILFYPFIISLILLMGYDKIVAALTVVGSTMIGIAGTTYAYGNVSILNAYLSTEIGNNIAIKIAILVVGLAVLIFNTFMYVKKLSVIKVSKESKSQKEDSKDTKELGNKEEVVEKKDSKKSTKKSTSKKSSTNKTSKTTKSSSTKKTTTKKITSKSSKNNNKAAEKDEDVIVIKNTEKEEKELLPKSVDKKYRIWPLVCGLVILFVILLLAFIPWSDAFGVKAMEDATNAVVDFKIFGFTLFGKLLGSSINPFGSWMITDMLLVMAIVALIIVIIYKVKIDDIIDGFVAGAKKALLPAVISLLIYVILVITTYHPFQLTIYKFVLDITKDFNVFTSSIVAVLSSLFNADPAYVFQAAVPYLSSLADTEVYTIIEILFQSMYGLSMLFVPTSIVLMGTLSYLNISYKEWLKSIWKLLVELFVILLIIMTILVLI